ITVKGLSIYGFSQPNTPTDTTPGADIVIGSRLPVSKDLSAFLPDHSPQNVEIIDNWLGLPVDESVAETPSSFGVWLFDGVNTKIEHNRIEYHDGSGILTSVTAEKTQIKENIIVGNGLRGMPHAIYLEGLIEDSLIADNLICGNDGSGVYLFKPDGAIAIYQNTIKFNGRRVPSAAVYLIGNDHQVTNNQISWQTGTGVTITAYPQSDRNLITNNTFNDLEGLSIDLNTRDREGRTFYQLGDGVNPPRDSRNRKRDTANKSINAPQFLSEDFYLIDGKVNIDGVADPGATVTLYQVKLGIPRDIKEQSPLASQSNNYGPLSEPLTEVVADKDGKFSFTFDNFTPGTIVSAIATKPDYGTSEPAFNAIIRSFDQAKST
ncbi:MAG: right-handed parallel beta-helix repeat-containing protein, partial [Waterburya sp.]